MQKNVYVRDRDNFFLESSWEMDQTEKNVHLSSITDILNSGE